MKESIIYSSKLYDMTCCLICMYTPVIVIKTMTFFISISLLFSLSYDLVLNKSFRTDVLKKFTLIVIKATLHTHLYKRQISIKESISSSLLRIPLILVQGNI